MDPNKYDEMESDNTNIRKNPFVCSEVFTDTLTGYPKYETGFKMVGCEEDAILHKQVTILFNFLNTKNHIPTIFRNRTSKV